MSNASANVRMYRLNELGDCFLITFTAGNQKSRLLIDCGSFRNNNASADRINEIVTAIHQEVGTDQLDVVVGTHQHNDHMSGFVHGEKELRKVGVKQVWLSWLDDPADPKAREVGKDHKNLVTALHKARLALGSKPLGARGNRSREVLDDVLGFYGATAKGAADGPPKIPAKAVEILKSIGSNKPKFLDPGEVIDMPGMPPGSVKVYVLGPPRDDEHLFDNTPKKDETFDPHLAARGGLRARTLAARSLAATKFMHAVGNRRKAQSSEEAQYPFAHAYKLRGAALRSGAIGSVVRQYHSDRARTIDNDWLDQAEALALYVDEFTNNSSLVLAIELVASGKVLLFAADAQTGNWLSWSAVKFKNGANLDDLLKRTVFYKVGHHASHNATLPEHFNKMKNADLVALIPVHKKDPNITKKNGWKMPATNLFDKLVDSTAHRVLQMDGDHMQCDPTKEPAKSSWKKIRIKPNETDMFIELDFAG